MVAFGQFQPVGEPLRLGKLRRIQPSRSRRYADSTASAWAGQEYRRACASRTARGGADSGRAISPDTASAQAAKQFEDQA